MESSTDNGIIGCGGSKQSLETPRLCAGGCGFFGTAENRGLCSKCYKDSLKVKMAKFEAAIIGIDVGGGVINPTPTDQVEIIGRSVDDDSLKSATSITQSSDDVINPSVVSVVKNNRCGLCNKKVGVLGFECRCGVTYCGTHRYPEAHSCGFDFKKAGKIIIQKENPVCKADKITDRV